VQEEGLKAASARIEALEEQVRDLEAKARDLEAQASSGAGGFLGGIGKSIFGESRRPAEPEPARGGPWSAQPSQISAASSGPWGRPAASTGAWDQAAPAPQWSQGGQNQWGQPAPSGGGSFLRGALGTAAGVAGGMLLANSLSGLFSGHHNSLGIGSGLGQNAAGSGTNPLGFDPMPPSPQNAALDDKSGRQEPTQAAYGSAPADDDDPGYDYDSEGWDGGSDDQTTDV
jgi:hypothetical protein